MSVELRPAAERYRSLRQGVESRHSFSFGPHYEPENVAFGPLTAHNEERVGPGAGFPDHRHVDVEIVTWVLAGALVHTDSLGHESVLRPGDLRVQSAGTGIVHAETGHPDTGVTRFVQAWLRPDEPGGEPAAGVTHLASEGKHVTERDGRVLAAAGRPAAPLLLGTASATLWLSRLGPGERVILPEAPLQHLHVAGGRARLPAGSVLLDDGDCLRVVDEPGLTVEAESPVELLIWAFG